MGEHFSLPGDFRTLAGSHRLFQKGNGSLRCLHGQHRAASPAHDLLGYVADDLLQACMHRAAACQAAAEAGYAPLIAQVLVGVADLALRRGQDEQAARLLAASAGVRGLPDRSHPDEARIEEAARCRLGGARFAEATREGTQTSWSQLIAMVVEASPPGASRSGPGT